MFQQLSILTISALLAMACSSEDKNSPPKLKPKLDAPAKTQNAEPAKPTPPESEGFTQSVENPFATTSEDEEKQQHPELQPQQGLSQTQNALENWLRK